MQAIDNVSNREIDEIVNIEFLMSMKNETDEIINYKKSNSGGFIDPKIFIENEIIHNIDGIINNPHSKLTPLDITINIEITKNKKMQIIKDIVVEKENLLRGETLPIKLIIERYRMDNCEKTIKIPIPQNLPDGEYEIVINSGNGLDSDSIEENGRRKKELTLATYLKKLSSEGKNNIISATLLSSFSKTIMKKKTNNIYPGIKKYESFLKRIRKNIEEKKVINNYIAKSLLNIDIPTIGTHNIKLSFGIVEEKEN